MFGWLVHLPGPYRVAPGLHPGLFPENYLLGGFWRYLVMTYHFGKHLMRQTKLWIFDLGSRTRVAGVTGGLEGGNFFWELLLINKIESLWNSILRDLFFELSPGGGGGRWWWGNSWRKGAFCSLYIFHNQKRHVYLIFLSFPLQNTCLKLANAFVSIARNVRLGYADRMDKCRKPSAQKTSLATSRKRIRTWIRRAVFKFNSVRFEACCFLVYDRFLTAPDMYKTYNIPYDL